MAVSNLVVQPLVTGGIGYLGSKFVLGNTGQLSLGGKSVDKNLALAMISAAGAVVANTTKDYIIPYIPINDITVKQVAQKAVGPVICGTSTVLLENMIYPTSFSGISGQSNSTSAIGNFMVGAGSYLAADYVTSMWRPM